MFLRLLLSWQVLVVLVWTVHPSQASDEPGFLLRGQCPLVQLGHGFDKHQFGGIWYRIGGLPNVEEKSVNCTVYDYKATGPGYTVSSTGLDTRGTPVDQSRILLQESPDVARFSTRIRDFDAEMVVLSTDYNSFSCLFTCYNFQGSHKAQFAWILSRTSGLSKEKIAKCQRELRDVGVPLEKLRGTFQGAGCRP
ncbi:crustacyanin-A1 subunit-like [Panulirus ornatus]|uniref:crustacyanin-A1 subunit-like n=1 Tax=Panulirus ornatus TaxID=150431 RepID=UPI003A898D77